VSRDVASRRKYPDIRPARGDCDRARLHDGFDRLRLRLISRRSMAASAASRRAPAGFHRSILLKFPRGTPPRYGRIRSGRAAVWALASVEGSGRAPDQGWPGRRLRDRVSEPEGKREERKLYIRAGAIYSYGNRPALCARKRSPGYTAFRTPLAPVERGAADRPLNVAEGREMSECPASRGKAALAESGGIPGPLMRFQALCGPYSEDNLF